VERELLRWLFHQPAYIECAARDVDLTSLKGTPERLIGRALLAAVDAGRLPPEAAALTPDSHSLSGLVAREVLSGLSPEANLFDDGRLVGEGELAQARGLCVVLAEEQFAPRRQKLEELYGMLLADLDRERLRLELAEAKRELAAARAKPDAEAAAVAQRRLDDVRLALKERARTHAAGRATAG